MDGLGLVFWIALACCGYAFYPPFRRVVNGWIVRIANRVKDDAEVPVAEPKTHLLEDIAFMMFKEDHPEDPRVLGAWDALPIDIRQTYIMRAVEPLRGADEERAPKAGS